MRLIMGKKLHIDNFMQFEQTDAQTGAMWKREREARLRSNAKYSFNILMEDEMSRTSFSKKENSGNYYTKKEVNPDRITPEMVTSLKENEIFVFGMLISSGAVFLTPLATASGSRGLLRNALIDLSRSA